MRIIIAALAVAATMSACGGSSAHTGTPTASPTPTPVPVVYVISTSAGLNLLRTVAADYENGDGAGVPLKCARGTLRLAVDGLSNAVGGDTTGSLNADSKTISKICDAAEKNGWPSVRDAVLKAIGS